MEAKRIVKELDKPQWIPVLGLPILTPLLAFGVCFMVALFFPAGFAVRGILAGLLFIALLVIARRLLRIDSKVLQLWFYRFQLGTYYDPALLEDQNEFPAVN